MEKIRAIVTFSVDVQAGRNGLKQANIPNELFGYHVYTMNKDLGKCHFLFRRNTFPNFMGKNAFSQKVPEN